MDFDDIMLGCHYWVQRYATDGQCIRYDSTSVIRKVPYFNMTMVRKKLVYLKVAWSGSHLLEGNGR